MEHTHNARERFKHEVKVLQSIDHPSVARFNGAFKEPPCLVMESVDGHSLHELMARGPIPEAECTRMLRDLADVLTYLHARGVWHRDIKPANIMFESKGWLKLVDFGIAISQGATRHTQEGILVGRLRYLPPEALETDSSDPVQWDLYSMGVIFHETLTGQAAFGEGTGTSGVRQARVLRSKLMNDCLDPGEGFDEGVRGLVRRMTARDPTQRFRNTAQVTRAIQELVAPTQLGNSGSVSMLALKGQPVRPITPAPPTPVKSPVPPPVPQAPVPSDTSRRVKRLGFMAAFAALLAGALWGYQTLNPAPPPVRVVHVEVTGLSAETPLRALLDEVDMSPVGRGYSMAGIPHGNHELRLLAGEGCVNADCPGAACASCCRVTVYPLILERGEGTQSLVIPRFN
jgi:serine/threonine protein kinase